MKLTRFESSQAFHDLTHGYLMEYEVEHNLMLDLTRRLVNGRSWNGGSYMAAVEGDHGVVGVALRTGMHNLILSRLVDLESLELIVQDVYKSYGTLPGVLGPPDATSAFCQQWRELSGQQGEIDINERIYQLIEVIPVQGVKGQMRLLQAGDRHVVLGWMEAFQNEALPDAPKEDQSASIDGFLDENDPTRWLYVWEAGQVVAMASAVGATKRSVRIGYVYTPPDLRGRGYGSALVAGLSQRMLDQGCQFCMLYTDLSNPTSNKIYQNIGYRPICDVDMYRFE